MNTCRQQIFTLQYTCLETVIVKRDEQVFHLQQRTYPFPNKSAVNSFENTLGKGEITRNEQFLLFPQCFYPFREHSAIFIKFKIVVYNFFQFGRA